VILRGIAAHASALTGVHAESDIEKARRGPSQPACAATSEIERAAAALGVPLDEHVSIVLAAMQAHAAMLGLNGAR
jgi:predicted hydrolase (HD superfamily)